MSRLFEMTRLDSQRAVGELRRQFPSILVFHRRDLRMSKLVGPLPHRAPNAPSPLYLGLLVLFVIGATNPRAPVRA